MSDCNLIQILACPPCPICGCILADVHQGVGVTHALKEAEGENIGYSGFPKENKKAIGGLIYLSIGPQAVCSMEGVPQMSFFSCSDFVIFFG